MKLNTNKTKTLYLTFDIDWACDEVLLNTYSLIKEQNIKATFFVTHQTPILDLMRGDENIELGLHPNFIPLLQGVDIGDDQLNTSISSLRAAETILKRIQAIVPEAKSIRAHSLVQSSRLLELYKSHGLSHVSDIFIPLKSGIAVKPFHLFNGLIATPYIWEDDLYCLEKASDPVTTPVVDDFLKKPGLKIFDFHPINIFLNTEHISRYENSRPFHHDPQKLREFINLDTSLGTANFFKDVCHLAKEQNFTFGKISDLEVLK